MNWLRQIASVTLFSLRTIPQRKGAALAAAVGIAGVVAVLVGVLSIAEGFRAAMTVKGADDVAIIMRSGADSEMTSNFSRDEVRLISDAPGVARNADGEDDDGYHRERRRSPQRPQRIPHVLPHAFE